MAGAGFEIKQGGVDDPRIIALLQAHLDDMYAITPAGSVHAFDPARLQGPDMRFWTAWSGQRVAGCGALKDHGGGLGEIKSMKTAPDFLRRGVGQAILSTITKAAREAGLVRLALETGATEHFSAAHALYLRNGYTDCGPFAEYASDPHSRFMERVL